MNAWIMFLRNCNTQLHNILSGEHGGVVTGTENINLHFNICIHNYFFIH